MVFVERSVFVEMSEQGLRQAGGPGVAGVSPCGGVHHCRRKGACFKVPACMINEVLCWESGHALETTLAKGLALLCADPWYIGLRG